MGPLYFRPLTLAPLTALVVLTGCALPTSFQAPEEPKDEPTAASRLGPGCQDTTFGEAKEGAFEVVVLADERTLGAKLPPAQLWPASLAELLGFGDEEPVVVHMVGCPDWTATEGGAWLSEQKVAPSLVLNALTGTPRGALAAAPPSPAALALDHLMAEDLADSNDPG
jgi:hypothetical protein